MMNSTPRSASSRQGGGTQGPAFPDLTPPRYANLEAAFIAGSNSTAALLSEVNYGECLLDTGAGEGKIGASVKQTLKNALTPLSDREYRPNTPPN